MTISRELSAEQAAALIRPDGVGRLAICNDTGADIFPLSYVVDGESLVFRISPHGSLGTHHWGGIVAFEVDYLDFEARRGWSVVVKGRAERIVDDDEASRLAETRDPTPWAEGMRRLYVRLTWTEITGRVIGDELVPSSSEPMSGREHHIGPWSHG